MFRPVVLFCVYMALTPFVANAITAEQKAQIHEHFEIVGLKCIKDNAINEEDIVNLRAKKVPTGPNAPCFLACMMKEIGVMDGEGKLQKDSILELVKKVFPEPEEVEVIGKFLHSCAPVNEEAVSDGEKGCDRAISAYKCMVEKAPEFGLEI